MAEGSKRGKTIVDWEGAFAYYAALPPGERSYAAVAVHFNVSPRTVETHGRTGGWKQRLRAIDAETAARTADVLSDARVDEVHKLRRLIEASLITYAERLRDGMRMSPADLERLNRLSLALIDETTSPRPSTDEHITDARTPEHTAAVLDALEEIGALEAIGLTRIRPDTTDANTTTKDSVADRDDITTPTPQPEPNEKEQQ